ncbi:MULTISPECIES: sodium-dependent transporter [unclassified Duganella]|jgi:NSS family neurotransmitter:Na+ symporter|uniref:sodium-dependent transporter n=1 Tax=unclassified Duganella TaxID=2636909 RepID=UPI00088587B8|nr:MULTISPECIES: sodium-dependent transporter [unclassified Duganella]SDH66316.1 neurotransmitter:Na+ symporter, NSS family [Duganella sp. OV458]SDK76355.1 neurotransmitter:Na+ symporter, NSS family [Duganella sp. OV510]
MNNKMTGRSGFSSSFGVLAATLGSAVGLGNIWKFPSLTGANGGAGFLLIYLLATLLIGLPVMIAEITMGRAAKANPITTLQTLAPKKGLPWWLVGVAGMLAAFLILSFYSEVVAWVFAYVFKAIGGSILSSDRQVTEAAFGALISDPLQSLLWQWGVLLLIGGILLMGVTKGIEGITKKLMPVLFLLLLVLCAVSLTLPKVADGIAFLFKPDFSKITAGVILTAMGLAFFKLSLGMGTMMTYGSYFRDDQNIPATTVRVMLADLFVSMLAGIAIFPAVFSFGFEPSAGPSLVFITIPAVFSQIPGGHLLMIAFFALAAVAATGAMLSMMEVPVVILHERFGMSRTKATVLTIAILVVLGSSCALTNNVLADFKLFGMNMFDLFDFASSNVLLPLGGIAIALFVGWVWGRDNFQRALSNHGTLRNATVTGMVFFLLRYVSPLLILVVMLKGLGLF